MLKICNFQVERWIPFFYESFPFPIFQDSQLNFCSEFCYPPRKSACSISGLFVQWTNIVTIELNNSPFGWAEQQENDEVGSMRPLSKSIGRGKIISKSY